MRREYNPEDTVARRTLAGARLAAISVAAGALATVTSLLGVAYVAAIGSERTRSAHDARLASHTEAPLARASGAKRLQATGEASVQEHTVGALVVVDIGAEIASLDEELDRQNVIAAREHRKVLIWLSTEACRPCDAVEAALPSVELQQALAGMRIVRLDAAQFLGELSRLGVPLDAFPAFLLLGPDGHVRDYLHGGEWDEDVPENIAPVLKSFVDGTRAKRRVPWRGGVHEDETPI